MGIIRKIMDTLKGNPSKQIIPPNHQNSISVSMFSRSVPLHLGVHSSVPKIQELVVRLETAMDTSYMEQVRERVLAKYSCSSHKYEWMLLEVKRYFVLCAIYKHVPMYSQEADLIWHEMIMFTRDYEQFCMNFIGEFIHHQPNVTESSTSDQVTERAMYDLIYSRFFTVLPENEQLSRPFFRHKLNLGEQISNPAFSLDKSLLSEMQSRFRPTQNPDIQRIQEELIQMVQSQMQEAEQRSNHLYSNRMDSHRIGNPTNKQKEGRIKPNQVAADPILSLLLLSAAADQLFITHPEEEMLEERKQHSGAVDGGGYIGHPSDKDDSNPSQDTDSSSSHSDGGSSGSDSSGSSSSSCGSSCGSGCSS